MAGKAGSRMVIPSKTTEAQTVKDAILEAARARRYPQSVLFGVRLALEEALSNAIHHGNGDDPGKTVTVDYEVSDEALRVTVCDEGGGFAPEQLPDPCCDENLARPGGRGVMLMKAYMDEVNFNDAGNRVTLVKYRQGGAAGPEASADAC